MGLAVRVLIGLVAGFLLGGAVAFSGSPWLEKGADLIQPLGQLWVSAIRMTVVPLVVSLLIVGVGSVKDLTALGRIGGRSIVLFLGAVFGSAALAVVLAAPLLSRLRIDPEATAALRETAGLGATPDTVPVPPSVADWVLGLIPVNPVAAAAEGALLPLIVFTIAFGVAASQIRDELRRQLVGFFEGVVEAMLVLVRWILEAAPVGVFALSLPLAMNLGLAAAGALLYYVLVVAVLCVLLVGLLYPFGALAGAVSVRRLAKAAAPAQGVAFSSRSSLAALPLLIEDSASILQLPAAIGGVFLPFAVSVLRITAPVGIVVGVLFLARLYGVDLVPAQLVSIGVMAALMSFTVPGIPGGSIIIMVPVLLAAGIPLEGIGVLLAIDTLPDMFRTTGNVTAHMVLAAVVARGLGEEGVEPVAGTAAMGSQVEEPVHARNTEGKGEATEPGERVGGSTPQLPGARTNL